MATAFSRREKEGTLCGACALIRECRSERWYEPRRGWERERGEADAADAADADAAEGVVGEVDISGAGGEGGARRGMGRPPASGLRGGIDPALRRLLCFVGGHGGFESGEDRSGEAGG